MSLFQEGEFTGHSGGQLKWKIECDALEIDDWKCLATMILDYEKRPFQAAIGIPRGGVMLGSFLNHYSSQNPKDPYLICDDVLTTGGSMAEVTHSPESYYYMHSPAPPRLLHIF